MIARDEEFFLAVRRGEGRACRVVGTGGQELEGKKWMGRAAFAQVDLDRVGPKALFRRGVSPQNRARSGRSRRHHAEGRLPRPLPA